MASSQQSEQLPSKIWRWMGHPFRRGRDGSSGRAQLNLREFQHLRRSSRPASKRRTVTVQPDTRQSGQNQSSRPWTSAFKSALTYVGLGRLFGEAAIEETHTTTDSPFFSPSASPQNQGGASTPLSPTSAGERLISETACFPAFPPREASEGQRGAEGAEGAEGEGNGVRGTEERVESLPRRDEQAPPAGAWSLHAPSPSPSPPLQLPRSRSSRVSRVVATKASSPRGSPRGSPRDSPRGGSRGGSRARLS
jgi:hypothetical protein